MSLSGRERLPLKPKRREQEESMFEAGAMHCAGLFFGGCPTDGEP